MHEARQIPDMAVALSGVERARSPIRGRDEEDDVTAAGRARSALRIREERGADTARLPPLRDEK